MSGDWKSERQVFLYTQLLNANRRAMADALRQRARKGRTVPEIRGLFPAALIPGRVNLPDLALSRRLDTWTRR